MGTGETRTAIKVAAERLRAIVLDAENGAFIGSEEALIATLGCSRSTVRQVARLLEREGLLRVRRGINGGYFGSRPDAGTIEATVSAYLETLDMDAEDVTVIASALWVETVQKAAGAPRKEALAVVARLRDRLKAIKDDAPFSQVRDLELESQKAIFALSNSNYVKLIFDINVAFSRRKFPLPIGDDDDPDHRAFVRMWRDAKQMELTAIASGDRELAYMASRHSRKIWHERVWSRHREPTLPSAGTD